MLHAIEGEVGHCDEVELAKRIGNAEVVFKELEGCTMKSKEVIGLSGRPSSCASACVAMSEPTSFICTTASRIERPRCSAKL